MDIIIVTIIPNIILLEWYLMAVIISGALFFVDVRPSRAQFLFEAHLYIYLIETWI